jgi:murein DD-endopeptidase MepM/ murein hydrolase activator NlpD
LVGGASQPIAAPPGWEELRPETPPELQAVIDRNTARRGGGGSLCGDGPGGIEFQPLAEAYGYIEGNYNSVGSYVDLGGDERGYGIGRYQYMTYRSDVREIILAKPGGEAVLRTADEGGAISAADVDRFFTPEDQNELFKVDQARNVEQALNEGFTGARLIERIGQIHYGGPGAPIDGDWEDKHERLTLKTYGQELAENYQKINSEATSKCKAATPIKPLETKITGSLAAQEYGTSRPNRGCYGNCHAGQDIDINEGEELQAYLGGVVTRHECHDGGYYCFIDIYNEELDVVFRVAEAEEILVEEGQTVEAGQVISRGHAPTGVIHIEIRTDADEQGRGGYGTAGSVDPIAYLEDVGVIVREGNSLVGTHDH